MFQTGIDSNTFRQNSVDALILLVQNRAIDTIEWDVDAHVPSGDLAKVRLVRERTTAPGLRVWHYGSCYRCDKASSDFNEVLDTAITVGAQIQPGLGGARGFR